MLSRFSRSCIRPVISTNLTSVLTSKRCFAVNLFSNKDEGEPDEKSCPKAKEFDDLMDKKKKENEGKPDLKLKGEDYPFELEEEDYVPMIDPKTGEWNPPRGCFIGAEPTRYGDWEIKGRCFDF